jgi:hypothetical protein
MLYNINVRNMQSEIKTDRKGQNFESSYDTPR